jgi:hypothetical protein
MDRPILAIDVDGVISLFGFDEPPPSSVARFELIDGMVHCISLQAGERLRRLGEFYDMVWATGWEEKANDYMPNVIGMPELPFLTFKGAARFGSAHWKLAPLDKYGKGRAMAWIDDSFARARGADAAGPHRVRPRARGGADGSADRLGPKHRQ